MSFLEKENDETIDKNIFGSKTLIGKVQYDPKL
jgi:hypothetical protein